MHAAVKNNNKKTSPLLSASWHKTLLVKGSCRSSLALTYEHTAPHKWMSQNKNINLIEQTYVNIALKGRCQYSLPALAVT
jgi:hypothetical protein